MFSFFKKLIKEPPGDNNDSQLDEVKDILNSIGYSLTEKGFGEAFTILYSGYTSAETALHILSIATANEVVENWGNPLFSINGLDHATSALLVLKPFRESGEIRAEHWDNNATAISQMLIPSPQQKEWVETVLQASISKGERVALRN